MTIRTMRNAILATMAGSVFYASPVLAQEDAPVPEDPISAEGSNAEEPIPRPEPFGDDDAPIGKVEAVEAPTAQKSPPTQPTPPEEKEGDETVELSAEEKAMADEVADSRLRTAFELRSEGAAANNLDMRDLNNDTFIDIYDTDDRATILFTRIGAAVAYDVLDDTTFTLGASHTGAWGGDSLGAANAFGGIFYLNALNIDWRPIESDSFGLGVTIGRQPFEIGGARYDYFLDDVIDGVVLTTDFGIGGKLRLVPIDVYALQRPDDVSIGAALGYAGPDQRYPTVGFDGDTNTIRFGGVYENTEIVDGLGIRLFGFYADIGAGPAPHTGADRAFYGAHGNFADNDFNWMGGARVGYDLDTDVFDLGIYGEFARSGGIDRKATQIGVRDVTANGNAFGGALEPRVDLGDIDLRAIGQFFYADGGSYTGEEGLLFNYGFVGMKGAQVGGLNMSRFAGWHPSAYVGTRGVYHTPQDTSRKAGTMLIHGGIGAEFVDLVELDLDAYLMRDTSTSNLDNFDDLGDIADELPFGYTEADLIPQERLGRPLGVELNARLGLNPSEALSLYTMGGVFLPGSFYEIEIPRTGGTALGAEDPRTFWAILGGAALTF